MAGETGCLAAAQRFDDVSGDGGAVHVSERVLGGEAPAGGFAAGAFGGFAGFVAQVGGAPARVWCEQFGVAGPYGRSDVEGGGRSHCVAPR